MDLQLQMVFSSWTPKVLALHMVGGRAIKCCQFCFTHAL